MKPSPMLMRRRVTDSEGGLRLSGFGRATDSAAGFGRGPHFSRVLCVRSGDFDLRASHFAAETRTLVNPGQKPDRRDYKDKQLNQTQQPPSRILPLYFRFSRWHDGKVV